MFDITTFRLKKEATILMTATLSLVTAPGALAGAPSKASSLSQNTTFEGTVEFQHGDDLKHGKSTEQYFLRTDSGQRLELKAKGKALHQKLAGARVRVKGTQSATTLALDTSGTTSSGSLQILSSGYTPMTVGEQKLAVILLNFMDNTSQPFTPAQVSSIYFGSSGGASGFFKENSFGQTWLSGIVLGYYTLPISITSNTFTVGSYAEQAVKAAGIDLSSYSQHVYVYPQQLQYPWAGLASMGSNPYAQVYMNGTIDLQPVTHELGHTLGLYHAHASYCGAVSLGTNCQISEYGDISSTMGGYSASHISAFQKEQLGWLNAGSNTPPITTVTASGTYSLDLYETIGSKPKALKILQGVNATTGAKTWYYIEHRQPVGFDAVLPNLMPGLTTLTQGVQVRIATEGDYNSSSLLDMTPDATSWNPYDAELLPGKTYTDSTAGLAISVVSADSTGAVVNVTFGSTPTPVCTHANPLVVFSPTSLSIAAGGSASFAVTVTNKDSSACSSSNFNLSTSLPSGVGGSLTTPSLSLAPGASGSTTLTVSSSSAMSAGTYSVLVNALNSSATAFSGTGSASLSIVTVPPASTLSMSVTTDKAVYAAGNSAYITASVAAGSSPVSGASVTFTVTKPNGAVVTASAVTDANGQAKYKLRLGRKDPVGTYQIKATTTSGGQSASGSTSFTVQ